VSLSTFHYLFLHIHVVDQPWKRRGKKKVNVAIHSVIGLLYDIISWLKTAVL